MFIIINGLAPIYSTFKLAKDSAVWSVQGGCMEKYNDIFLQVFNAWSREWVLRRLHERFRLFSEIFRMLRKISKMFRLKSDFEYIRAGMTAINVIIFISLLFTVKLIHLHVSRSCVAFYLFILLQHYSRSCISLVYGLARIRPVKERSEVRFLSGNQICSATRSWCYKHYIICQHDLDHIIIYQY